VHRIFEVLSLYCLNNKGSFLYSKPNMWENISSEWNKYVKFLNGWQLVQGLGYVYASYEVQSKIFEAKLILK
jgi:hypothetical protein